MSLPCRLCGTDIGLTLRRCPRLQFSTVQNTQELFGPAGLAFMKMAAHMNHVGQPIKLLYGINGHGGRTRTARPRTNAAALGVCRLPSRVGQSWRGQNVSSALPDISAL